MAEAMYRRPLPEKPEGSLAIFRDLTVVDPLTTNAFPFLIVCQTGDVWRDPSGFSVVKKDMIGSDSRLDI